MFLTTRAGYVPVHAIALIEHDETDDGFVKVFYDIGSGYRETVAHVSAVSRFLDWYEPEEIE